MKKIVSLLVVFSLIFALTIPAAAAPADTPSISREDLEEILDEETPLSDVDFIISSVVVVGADGTTTTFSPGTSDAELIAAALMSGTSEAEFVLSADALSTLAGEDEAPLVMVSGAGVVSIPSDALDSLVEQAGQGEVSIILSREGTDHAWDVLSGHSDLSKEQMENADVIRFDCTVGGKQLQSFGGSTFSLMIPVDGEKYQPERYYPVYHAAGNGVVSRIKGQCSFLGSTLVNVSTNYLGTFAVLPEVIEDSADDGAEDFLDSDFVASPQTGEAAASPVVAVLAVTSGVAAAALFFAARKKEQEF